MLSRGLPTHTLFLARAEHHTHILTHLVEPTHSNTTTHFSVCMQHVSKQHPPKQPKLLHPHMAPTANSTILLQLLATIIIML